MRQIKTRRLCCRYGTKQHTQVDKDTFSHVPTCHITDGCKVNKFHRHTDFIKAFGRVSSHQQNKTPAKPYPFKTQALTKVGTTDSKSFAFFPIATENKILKPFCSETKQLRMPLPQAQGARDQRLLLKNNLNYLPPVTQCEARLHKTVHVS